MKIKEKTPAKRDDTPKPLAKAECANPIVEKVVPEKRRVTFSVRAEVGSKVFLAGDFNKWDPSAKKMSDKRGDGVYSATLKLCAGDHPYKFVINGTWCADPECPDWVQNEHGTLNSVKHVS